MLRKEDIFLLLNQAIPLIFLLIFVVVVALWVGLRKRKEMGREVVEGEEVAPRTWGLGDVLLALGIALFMLSPIAFVGSILGELRGVRLYINLVLLMVQESVLLGVVILWVVGIYKRPVGELGLNWLHWKEDIALGLKWCMPVIVLAMVVEKGIYGVLWLLVGRESLERILVVYKAHEPVSQMVSMAYGWFNLFAVVLLLAFIAPVCEEIVFRGFTYTAFRRRFGVKLGIVLSGVLFGLFHFNLLELVPLVVIGVILAYLYERRGSLTVPIIVHMLNNVIGLLILRFLPEVPI